MAPSVLEGVIMIALCRRCRAAPVGRELCSPVRCWMSLA